MRPTCSRSSSSSAGGITSGAVCPTRPTPSSSAPACSSAVSRRFCRSRSEACGSPAASCRRRLPRPAPGLVPGGVPQQDGLDHPDPDAALPVDHPLDAVLVRPALRRAVPGGARSVGRGARRHARPPRGTSPRAPAAGSAEEAPRQVGERQGQGQGQSRTKPLPCPARAKVAPPKPAAAEEAPKPSRAAAVVGAAAAALRAAASRPTPPAIKRPTTTSMEPTLPLSDAEKLPAEKRRSETRRLRAAAARAARRAQGRTQSRRAGADGRRQAARGEVPRVLGRRHRRADPPRPGRHDVRVQARRRRQVQQDHRAGRRPVPGDAGRVGPDRSHSGKVHGRHPDSQPESRADLDARPARVGGLPPLDVPAHARARQDHPRRAVRQRPGDDAAPADRRLDRHGQVGQRERDALEHPLPRDARRSPADHDRPEAARARDVRGHPAPADAGGRRSQARGERAALGGARDGRALQDARGRRRPQHRAVQPQHQDRHDRESGARSSTRTASRSRPCPSSSCSSTSWRT